LPANGNFATTYVFDPAYGTWASAGSMNVGRYGHSVTLLPNGKLLAAGGSASGSEATNSCELFDPDAGQWSLTGSLLTNRQYHAAALLPSGKLLVCGGHNYIGGYHPLATA